MMEMYAPAMTASLGPEKSLKVIVFVVSIPALISLDPRTGLGISVISNISAATATGMPRIRAPAQSAAVMRGRGRSLI